MHRLRYTIRKLARTPLFTTVAVFTLALGIGANTAVFSVVNGVLIQPLAFDAPDELVGVWHAAPGIGFDLLNQSPALYFTYREESEVFAESGMWDNSTVSVTGLEEPEQVSAIRVTDGIFPLLRVQPHAGRLFSAEDDSPDTPLTVILSHEYWQERFGGDPSVLGDVLEVNGRAREIIGVMGTELEFLDYEPSLFMPFQFDRGEVFFGNFSYQGIARLKPGMTVAQAKDDMTRMIALSIELFPLPPGFEVEMFESAGFVANPRPLMTDVVGDVGSVLWVLLGTVAMVLLIACANVANLFLVRAEGRTQEIAVRTALGAGRGRIARELLSESVFLGLLGGIAGLGLATAGIRLLVSMGPRDLPRLDEITIDTNVLLFTFAISLVAGLLFGAAPALKLRGSSLVTALKEGGRGGSAGRERHRVRNALVVSQIALALVLLIGSGLMIRSFQKLRDVEPGFTDPDTLLTFRVAVPSAEVEDPIETFQLQKTMLDALGEIPGVESVSMTTSATMDGWNSADPMFVESQPTPEGQIPMIRRFKWIAPDYFGTMGNPVVAGRDFTWAELYDRAAVAIISEKLATEYWDTPSQAIGERIRQAPQQPWRTIVGVVGNVYDDGVDQELSTIVYWPTLQDDFWEEGTGVHRGMRFVLRSDRVGTATLLDEARQAVWTANPNLPVASVRTMGEVLARSMARTSFTLTMLGIAAAAAMLIGAVGIYGVTSYIVAQRTREIGVRIALGAQYADINRMVLRFGLKLCGLGVAVGLAGAFGLTQLMSALLFGVSAMDPITYGSVAGAVTVVALIACYLPARRAAGLDPVEALRD